MKFNDHAYNHLQIFDTVIESFPFLECFFSLRLQPVVYSNVVKTSYANISVSLQSLYLILQTYLDYMAKIIILFSFFHIAENAENGKNWNHTFSRSFLHVFEVSDTLLLKASEYLARLGFATSALFGFRQLIFAKPRYDSKFCKENAFKKNVGSFKHGMAIPNLVGLISLASVFSNGFLISVTLSIITFESLHIFKELLTAHQPHTFPESESRVRLQAFHQH